jgi:Fe2+ or Zn2+ uptake regulation protein
MTEAEILDHLRASGYRLTAPRRKLVDILLRADAPLTAEAISKRARAARVAADLSTIYRNLATFCALGWLDALPGANGECYYQVHHAEEPTLSVMCLDCGKMTALAALPPTMALNDAVRGLGLSADSLRVTLAAHCEHDCPRKPGN